MKWNGETKNKQCSKRTRCSKNEGTEVEQTVRKKDLALAKKQAELQQTQGTIASLKYENDLLLMEVCSVAVTVFVFWCLLWGFIRLCAFHYFFK
jgi:hypothetical protein